MKFHKDIIKHAIITLNGKFDESLSYESQIEKALQRPRVLGQKLGYCIPETKEWEFARYVLLYATQITPWNDYYKGTLEFSDTLLWTLPTVDKTGAEYVL